MLSAVLIISLLLAFEVCADQCVFGPTIINSNDTTFGEISSNSEGTNYKSITFCSWKFELAHSEVLRLRPTRFSVGSSFDGVTVRGSGRPFLRFWDWGRFSGSTPDDSELACITGSIPTSVDFETTSGRSGPGFALEYEIVKRNSDEAFDGCTRKILDTPWHCSRETTIESSNSTSGLFSSNSAGIDYLDDNPCSWKFKLADDEVLQLSSRFFNVKNYVVQFLSNTSPPFVLLEWGGYRAKDPQENELICISGSIGTTVGFDAGPLPTSAGFTMEYKIVKSSAAGAFDGCTRTILDEPWHCSDVVKLRSRISTTGTVATNSGGIDFPNDAVCTWNFYTSPDEEIGLKFISFDLNHSSNDAIIRDIDSSVEYEKWDVRDSNVVGRTFRSDLHHNVSLVFISRSFGRGSGFVVEYTFYNTGCADSDGVSPLQLLQKKTGNRKGCKWLTKQDSTTIALYCSNFSNVRRKCPVLCDSCQSNQTACNDSGQATFPTFIFLTKSCRWLSRKTTAQKKKLCRLNQTARKSCPLTCDACP